MSSAMIALLWSIYLSLENHRLDETQPQTGDQYRSMYVYSFILVHKLVYREQCAAFYGVNIQNLLAH